MLRRRSVPIRPSDSGMALGTLRQPRRSLRRGIGESRRCQRHHQAPANQSRCPESPPQPCQHCAHSRVVFSREEYDATLCSQIVEAGPVAALQRIKRRRSKPDRFRIVSRFRIAVRSTLNPRGPPAPFSRTLPDRRRRRERTAILTVLRSLTGERSADVPEVLPVSPQQVP